MAASIFRSAAPFAVIVSGLTLQSALALTLASQCPSHFASTVQPPSSLPPSHFSGVALPVQPALHSTFAEPGVAAHSPLHSPTKVPSHFASGLTTEQLPLHLPWQLPPESVEPSHVPSHLPWQSTPPCAVQEPFA